MTAARAKARKMAARFRRPRRRVTIGAFATAALRLAGTAMIAGPGLQQAVIAAADFEAAYARLRATGSVPSPAEFAKLRAVQP